MTNWPCPYRHKIDHKSFTSSLKKWNKGLVIGKMPSRACDLFLPSDPRCIQLRHITYPIMYVNINPIYHHHIFLKLSSEDMKCLDGQTNRSPFTQTNKNDNRGIFYEVATDNTESFLHGWKLKIYKKLEILTSVPRKQYKPVRSGPGKHRILQKTFIHGFTRQVDRWSSGTGHR